MIFHKTWPKSILHCRTQILAQVLLMTIQSPWVLATFSSVSASTVSNRKCRKRKGCWLGFTNFYFRIEKIQFIFIFFEIMYFAELLYTLTLLYSLFCHWHVFISMQTNIFDISYFLFLLSFSFSIRIYQ
jgi:hypothetical protein